MKLINFFYRHQTSLFLSFVLIISLALYAPILHAFFVSDDWEWLAVSIQRNPWTFFVTNYAGSNQGGSFGPLVNLFYYFNYQISALNPWSYHLSGLLLHVGNISLVYFLAKRFFNQTSALIAALIFTVYFNNAEAVAWIAAIPHILSTFFFLLSIYLCLCFREKQKSVWYVLSLFSFILALGAKEIAISLPLVLAILGFIDRKKMIQDFGRKKILYLLSGYFLVLAFYLFWRYQTTGLVFGYYGRSQLGFNPKVYVENFYYLMFTFVSSGDFRLWLLSVVKNYLKILLPLSVLFLATLFYLKRSLIKNFWPYIFLFLVILAPYLSLAPNPLNNEGERYTYLPVIFLLMILALVLNKLIKYKFILGLVVLWIIVLSSAVLLYQKNKLWQQAALVAKNIVTTFDQQVDIDKPGLVYFIYLPDNLAGTQIFRNAIIQAIDLSYPQHQLDLKTLPIHINLTSENQAQALFVWEKREQSQQLLGHTINKDKLITGPIAAQANEDLRFELWGYDYNTFITDRIFLEFTDQLLINKTNQAIYFLYYDQGSLRLLDY